MVKASLERATRLSSAVSESLVIDSISVKDGQTIIVTTLEPRPTLPGLLTSPRWRSPTQRRPTQRVKATLWTPAR